MIVAELRWRMFAHSLRTTRGKTELLSWGIVALVMGMGAFGGAIGMGAAAWYFVSSGNAVYLALLLWSIFVFWQLFPLVATAFTNNPDASGLLRFPLSYGSYYAVRLGYGVFDPATALGSIWLTGIWIGIGAARPMMMPWAFVALTAFAGFNLLFMQMVFAWVERWLAQRRTREIMGVLFVLLMLSFQLTGPIMQHLGRRTHPQMRYWITVLAPLQAAFPPGLAAESIANAATGRVFSGLGYLLGLFAFSAAMGYLLHLRLRAQYLGENLSEAAPAKRKDQVSTRAVSWAVPGVASPIAAVLEKELRYLSRSGPMLLTLIMPVFMMVIFRFGPAGSARGAGFITRVPAMAFPAAAAYSLVILTNLVYNNFGGDASGIQFFYASPVLFRQIVMAKNLAHFAVLLAEIVTVWTTVNMLYGAPPLDVTIATLAGLLFATPLNLTVGNMLSLYSPKKLDFSTFGRQRASQTTVLASLGVQFFILGIGGLTFWLAERYHEMWMAAVAFLMMAVVTIFIYALTLKQVDAIAMNRRETLLAELCKA